MNERTVSYLVCILIISVVINMCYFKSVEVYEERIENLYKTIYETIEEKEEEILIMIEDNEERIEKHIDNILTYASDNEYIFEEHGIKNFYTSGDFDYECSELLLYDCIDFENSFLELFYSIEEFYHNMDYRE